MSTMEEFIAACLRGDLADVKAAAPAQLDGGELRSVLRVVCHRGRLDVVKWVVARFGVREAHVTAHDCADTLDELCSAPLASAAPAEERVRTAQWLTNRFRLTEALSVRAKRTLLVRACKHGQTETVRWLVGAFELGRADVVARRCAAFIGACGSGDLELVCWLAEEFNLTQANARVTRCGFTALTLAIEHGNVQVAQWLFNKFGLTAEDVRTARINDVESVLVRSSRRGYFGVVRWLVDDVGVTIEEARSMFQAARQGMPVAESRNDRGCRIITELLVAKFGPALRDLPD
jgi:Ankyrin repeats (3 copies)